LGYALAIMSHTFGATIVRALKHAIHPPSRPGYCPGLRALKRRCALADARATAPECVR